MPIQGDLPTLLNGSKNLSEKFSTKGKEPRVCKTNQPRDYTGVWYTSNSTNKSRRKSTEIFSTCNYPDCVMSCVNHPETVFDLCRWQTTVEPQDVARPKIILFRFWVMRPCGSERVTSLITHMSNQRFGTGSTNLCRQIRRGLCSQYPTYCFSWSFNGDLT